MFIKKILLLSFITISLLHSKEKIDFEIKTKSIEGSIKVISKLIKNNFELDRKQKMSLYMTEELYLNYVDMSNEGKVLFYFTTKGKNFNKQFLNDFSNRLICFTDFKKLLEIEDNLNFYFDYEYVKSGTIDLYHSTGINKNEVNCEKYKKEENKHKRIEQKKVIEEDIKNLSVDSNIEQKDNNFKSDKKIQEKPKENVSIILNLNDIKDEVNKDTIEEKEVVEENNLKIEPKKFSFEEDK